jgi:hypothetical protein
MEEARLIVNVNDNDMTHGRRSAFALILCGVKSCVGSRTTAFTWQ